MKQIIRVLVVILLIAACTPNFISRLYQIEGIICDNPQGALDSLKRLEGDVPNMTEREKAYYSLLYAMSLDKSYIDTTDVSILEPAIEYYTNHGSAREKLLSLYYLGRIQENSGSYSESIVTFTRALEQNWNDKPYRGRIYMAMADAYCYSYNFVEEAKCVDSAAFYYYQTGDTLLVRVARFRKAISLVNNRKKEEARAIFDELLSQDDLEYHLRRDCMQQDAYLTVLLEDNSRFSQASELFNASLEMGLGMNANHAAAYAYLLYNEGDKDSANSIFDSLNSMNDALSIAASEGWRSRISFEEREFARAFRQLENSLVMVDSVVVQSLNQSLLASQRDYLADRILRERQYVNLLKARQTVLLLSIILFWGVILCVSIIIRHKNIQKIGQYESALEELKTELLDQTEAGNTVKEDNRRLYEQFKNVYKRHFDLLASFYEEYDIQRRNGVPEDKRNRLVLKIINSLQGEAESNHQFEQIVDADMNGILSQFKDDFPELTERDHLLFCYYVAGFSTKFISMIIKGVSADSIYVRKSRMKKVIEKSDSPRKERYLEYL